MDLLNDQRSLNNTGKLLRHAETGQGMEELFVMLFDNYCERFGFMAMKLY
jgi:hypothetical protein